MATTPTSNPIPSEAPQDLKFNAGKIDEFVTSKEWTYTDRFGIKRYTIEGINYLAQQVMNAFGYVTLQGVTFTTGATVANPNEVLFNTADNSYYKWSGSFASGGKAVPANSTPESSGGVGPGKWLNVGDTALRKDLAGPNGVSLVGGALKQADLTLQSITKIGSYSNTNVVPAWIESVSKYGYVYFPGHSSSKTTYNIVDTVGQLDNLKNSRVIVDKNVILSFDYDYYTLLKTLNFVGQCEFNFKNLNFNTSGGQVDYIPNVAKLNANPILTNAIPWSDARVLTLEKDLDTFTEGGSGATSASSLVLSLFAQQYGGLFTEINTGETISANVAANSGSTIESSGVMLRGDAGWILFDGFVNGTEWRYRVKTKGQPIVNADPIPVPEGGNLKSYSPGLATIGITLTGPQSFSLTINGVSINPRMTSQVGNIYEIGFVGVNPTASILRVTGLICYSSDNSVSGHAPLNILVRGDSTAEGFISAFDKYLPQLLDGNNGTRSLNITNKAIAGTFMRQQLDDLKSEGAGDAYIIIMAGGTNEGQVNTSPDTFAAMVKEFADWCISQGRVPVWIEPWMWYDKSFVGGNGQSSANYQNASALREAGKRVMSSYGDLGICITTTHNLPAPMPVYRSNPSIDPLLRDDIHQSQLGYKLYAEIIASSIAKWCSKVSSVPNGAATWWARGQAAVAFPSTVTRRKINISLTLTSFVNSSVAFKLPRGCRPLRAMNFPAIFSPNGTTYSTAIATVAVDGQISIKGLPSGTGTVYIDASW